MRKCLLMALACVLATGLYGYAQEGHAATQTKTGTVEKVDAEGKTVTVKFEGRALTFSVTADTEIVQGDAVKTLADVKVGAKVTVEYARHSDEKRVAVKITILPAAGGGNPG